MPLDVAPNTTIKVGNLASVVVNEQKTTRVGDKIIQEILPGSPVEDPASKVYVRNNDRVVKGQPLASLDLSRLRDALVQSKASLLASQASVAQARATVAQTRENRIYNLTVANSNISVTLTEAVKDGAKLHAMLHEDTGAKGTYEFKAPSGKRISASSSSSSRSRRSSTTTPASARWPGSSPRSGTW